VPRIRGGRVEKEKAKKASKVAKLTVEMVSWRTQGSSSWSARKQIRFLMLQPYRTLTKTRCKVVEEVLRSSRAETTNARQAVITSMICCCGGQKRVLNETSCKYRALAVLSHTKSIALVFFCLFILRILSDRTLSSAHMYSRQCFFNNEKCSG
jgi:hypothetical protein